MFKSLSALWAVVLLCAVGGQETLSAHLRPAKDLEATRLAITENMRKYMNESADPCENFFEFACGNWRTHHPSSASVIDTRAIFVAMNEIEPCLQSWLTTEDDTDTNTERKVKDFFNSCLTFDVGTMQSKLKQLATEFGPMPALEGEKWQEDEFDWLKRVAEISYEYDINIILGRSIAQHINDSSANMIYIDFQKLEDFNSTEMYTLILQDLLSLEMEQAEQIVKESIEFESSLQQGIVAGLSEMSTLRKLHEKYSPDFDLNKLMRISFGYLPEGEIYDLAPIYVENVVEVMRKTPKRVVANYISLMLIKEFSNDLIPLFTPDVLGPCTSKVKSLFPDVLSYMIYKKKNLSEKVQYIDDMWQDLKHNYQMILESSDLYWYDDDAREYALEKLHSLEMVVPTYMDNNFDEEYGQWQSDKSDFIANLKSVKQLNALRKRESVKRPPQTKYKGFSLSTPAYNPKSNTITVPVSLIQADIMLSPSQPKVVNYGHLGFLLAHEILHGFSGAGRDYNRLGSRNTKHQWGRKVDDDYEKRVKCLYRQYRRYKFGGVSITRDKLQTENIADNFGLLLTYRAYRRWYEDKARTEEELKLETLPNLNYTNEQLFFLAYSQGWCADIWEEHRARVVLDDSHTTDEFRAYLPLRNSDEFTAAFHCPKGSPMNPVKKCKFYERK